VLSFLKRKDIPAPASAVDEAAAVQTARTRARRRLIGAAVLVGVGIIGFPLLFETQPRPIAVDIPIEIPSKDAVAPLALPAPKAGVPAPRAGGAVRTERPVETPIETAPPVAAAASSPMAASAASAPAKPERTAAASSTAGVVAHRAAAPSAMIDRDAQRAQALLEGKPVASSDRLAASPASAAASDARTARFVVQAGAYTDAVALREARQKVEKLGMKTYTQVVETESGVRTRVRVGPFATREEAEKAAARIKGSGLAANILSL
jgi:DedD protein